MEHKPKLAAALARQSMKDQEGINAQFLIASQKAAQDSYVIPDSRDFRFAENNVSGQATNRREWERLVSIVESGHAPFDRVYIKARPRFGRWKDPREHIYWELRFAKQGVRIIYCNEENHLDFTEGVTNENLGQFLMSVLEGMYASLEVTTTTKRTSTGARTRLINGFFPGGVHAYGTERWLVNAKTQVPDRRVEKGERVYKEGYHFRLAFTSDERITAVKRVFELMLLGHGTHAAAGILTREGLPAPAGKEWNANAVLRIARNPVYTGTLIWGRHRWEQDKKNGALDLAPVEHDEVIAESSVPIQFTGFVPDPPITTETFEAVQRLLDGTRETWNQRHATAPQYLLTGILHCAACGAPFHGSTHRRDGKVKHEYYQHSTYVRNGMRVPCPIRPRHLAVAGMDAAVLGAISELVSDESLQAGVRRELEDRLSYRVTASDARTLETVRGVLADKKDELKAVIRQQASLSGSALEASLQVVQEIQGEVDVLAAREKSLVSDGAVLQALLDDERSILDMVAGLNEIFAHAPNAERKEVLANLVPRIEVHAGDRRVFLRLRTLG